MIGGYQILDLRKISLELSSDTQTFTDVDILKQLRNLRDYIEKGHNYSKALNKAMKDIKIRYRDGKLGEKIEVCEHAGIYCSNDSLTYELKTKNLMIEVVFEEKTDDDGNNYYDIKTAKYIYSNDEIIDGDLKVSGDITVIGDAEVDDLQVNSDTTIDGDLSVGGDLVVTGKINNEANPSVKPIYCHPINIIADIESDHISISLFIFSNKADAYTWSTFLTWLADLTQAVTFARIITTGSVVINNVRYPANYLYSSAQQKIFSIDLAIEKTLTTGEFEALTPTVFNDGVNKIN